MMRHINDLRRVCAALGDCGEDRVLSLGPHNPMPKAGDNQKREMVGVNIKEGRKTFLVGRRVQVQRAACPDSDGIEIWKKKLVVTRIGWERDTADLGSFQDAHTFLAGFFRGGLFAAFGREWLTGQTREGKDECEMLRGDCHRILHWKETSFREPARRLATSPNARRGCSSLTKGSISNSPLLSSGEGLGVRFFRLATVN